MVDSDATPYTNPLEPSTTPPWAREPLKYMSELKLCAHDWNEAAKLTSAAKRAKGRLPRPKTECFIERVLLWLFESDRHCSRRFLVSGLSEFRRSLNPDLRRAERIADTGNGPVPQGGPG